MQTPLPGQQLVLEHLMAVKGAQRAALPHWQDDFRQYVHRQKQLALFPLAPPVSAAVIPMLKTRSVPNSDQHTPSHALQTRIALDADFQTVERQLDVAQ
jgi:hypothetical protein